MDEAFFGGKAAGKRGRGSENKTEVAVALQLDSDGHPQFLKMQVIPDVKGSTLLAFAKNNVTEGSTIHSDAFRSYNALSEDCCCNMQKYNPQSGDGRLKWLHVMISNIKANIEGAYHGLDGTYLQRYLDEFCYRLTDNIAGSYYLTIYWRAVYGHLIRRWLSLVYNHYKK